MSNKEEMAYSHSLNQRFTKDEVQQAIVKCRGLSHKICAYLDCSYNQLNVWYTHHKDHKELADEMRQSIIDKAEAAIDSLLDEDVPPNVRFNTAQFVLKTQGKDRGWNEARNHQEIKLSREGELSIKQIFGIDG